METGEKQPIPLQELLGIMVAPEFECSVAAAELNTAVAEALENNKKQPVRALVDLSTDKSDTYSVVETSWRREFVAGLNYRLVLTQEHTNRESTVASKPEQASGFRQVLRKLLSNTVQPPELPLVTETPPQPPMLAAIIAGKYLLPLATFEKRQNGTCSFVQIGSEIKDDKLHTVRTDDAVTSRKVIIEDIRNFDSKSNEVIPTSLLTLVASEAPKYMDVLHTRLEQDAGQVVERQLGYQKHDTTLTVMEPGCEPREQVFSVRPLSVPIMGDDKRIYTFVLSTENQEGKQTIGTVVRGQLYLPLINIQPDFPHFESVHAQQRLQPAQLQTLIRFIGAAPTSPANDIANADHDHSVSLWGDTGSGFHDTTMQQIRQIQLNFQTRQATATRIKSYAVISPQKERNAWPLIKPSDPAANLAQFIADLSGPLAVDGEDIDRLPSIPQLEQTGKFGYVARDIRGSADKQTRLGKRLLNEFTHNIQTLLPPAEQNAHERIIDFLGLIDCTRPLVGELEGVNIGTVKGDLTIRAEVQRSMDQFKCTIYAAPKALGTTPVRLYEFSANPFTGKLSDPDRANDVLNLLTTLKPEEK